MVHGCPLDCVMVPYYWMSGKAVHGGQLEHKKGPHRYCNDQKANETVQ